MFCMCHHRLLLWCIEALLLQDWCRVWGRLKCGVDLGCCGDMVTDEFNIPLFCIFFKKSLSINKRIPLQLGFTVKHSAPARGNCVLVLF